MSLGIGRHGIVRRAADGVTTIVRIAPTCAPLSFVEVPADVAAVARLWTGDIAGGCVEEVDAQPPDPASGRLVHVETVNGMDAAAAADRPAPRSSRNRLERSAPDRAIGMSPGPRDTTGRMLAFAAPLGLGVAGVVLGPHGSGRTRTLRSLAEAVVRDAPDADLVILLIDARGEEVTDWRRRFPDADVVVCPPQHGAASDALLAADLVLEAAQRRTELGRDVALLVDSLSALWGAMLEEESADAQAEADHAQARQRIRAWLQRAGCFHGEGLLGSGLGGSLTILGTVWDAAFDEDAEAEGELHPHLRLMEHIGADVSWRAALCGDLAGRRMFPAIDIAGCTSHDEDRLAPQSLLTGLRDARRGLCASSVRDAWQNLMDAIEDTEEMDGLVQKLAPERDASEPPAWRRLLDW